MLTLNHDSCLQPSASLICNAAEVQCKLWQQPTWSVMATTCVGETRKSQLSMQLNEILKVSSPPPMLEYFVQYMESVGALPLVQFWMAVETFKSSADDYSHSDWPTQSLHTIEGRMSDSKWSSNSCELVLQDRNSDLLTPVRSQCSVKKQSLPPGNVCFFNDGNRYTHGFGKSLVVDQKSSDTCINREHPVNCTRNEHYHGSQKEDCHAYSRVQRRAESFESVPSSGERSCTLSRQLSHSLPILVERSISQEQSALCEAISGLPYMLSRVMTVKPCVSHMHTYRCSVWCYWYLHHIHCTECHFSGGNTQWDPAEGGRYIVYSLSQSFICIAIIWLHACSESATL